MVRQVTKHKAEIRNKRMIELADNIMIEYISPGIMLKRILNFTFKSITNIF